MIARFVDRVRERLLETALGSALDPDVAAGLKMRRLEPEHR